MVTIQPVTCEDIPVEYIDELPTESSGSLMTIIDGKMVNEVPKDGGIASKRVKRGRPIQARPLAPIDLETISDIDLMREAGRVYSNMGARGLRANLWFEKSGGVSGKWIEFPEFPNDKTVVGMRDLTGCTAVMIITPKGVFMVHIWETFFVNEESVPLGADDIAEEDIITVGVDEFDRNVIEPLISGGHPGVASLLGLIGTDQGPGQLHHTKQPTIVVITPHDYDRHGKVFRYQSHAQRLADRLGRALYPNGYPDQKEPLIKGYDPKAMLTDEERPQIPLLQRRIFRKIALEVTKRNEVIAEKRMAGPGRKPMMVLFRGAWRLWAGPSIALEQHFWDEDSWFEKSSRREASNREKRDEPEAEEEEDVDPCLYWDAPPASAISPSSLLSTEMMSPTTEANGNLPRTLLTTTRHSKITTKSSETEPAGLSG